MSTLKLDNCDEEDPDPMECEDGILCTVLSSKGESTEGRRTPGQKVTTRSRDSDRRRQHAWRGEGGNKNGVAPLELAGRTTRQEITKKEEKKEWTWMTRRKEERKEEEMKRKR